MASAHCTKPAEHGTVHAQKTHTAETHHKATNEHSFTVKLKEVVHSAGKIFTEHKHHEGRKTNGHKQHHGNHAAHGTAKSDTIISSTGTHAGHRTTTKKEGGHAGHGRSKKEEHAGHCLPKIRDHIKKKKNSEAGKSYDGHSSESSSWSESDDEGRQKKKN